MALFQSRIVQVATVAEVTYGTTPATPAFQIERFLPSDGLQTDKQSQAIEDMHVDPNIRDDVELAQDVQGSYNFLATYGTVFDTWLARALRGTWATDVLDNGSQRLPFAVERKFLSGSSAAYSVFNGQEVDKMSLDFTARKSVSGSLSLVGQKESPIGTTAISGATYTAAPTNVITTGNSIAVGVFAGLSTIPKVKSIKLNIDHSFQAVEVLGSKYRIDQIPGLINVTGEVEALIETAAPGDVHNLALNHSTGDLNFTIGSVANNKYTFDLAACRFLVSKINGSGQNGAVMATITFAARYDGTNGSIRVTKAVA